MKMKSENSKTDKILIIGAGNTGCSGLAIAQGLKKHGIPYALYERAETPHSKRNWTFGLHWGYSALSQLAPSSLLSQLQTCTVDPAIPADLRIGVTSYNGLTGEILAPIPSAKIYRLRRDLFRNLLLSGLTVTWNKRLASISYSSSSSSFDGARTVTAHFTDGTSDTGLALIGCDGAHSAVRTQLVGKEGAELEPTGFACAMLQTRHTAEHARYLRSAPYNPLYNAAVHPDGHFAWLAVHTAEDPERPEEWVFASYISSKEEDGRFDGEEDGDDGKRGGEREEGAHALLAEQKRLAAKFARPFCEHYAWARPETSTIEYVRLQNWDPRKPGHRWDSKGGRVSLAGDSAHPMTFQRGQGLNCAMQDALVYVEACVKWWGKGSDGDMESARARAMEEYEEEMIARGGAEVQLSEETTRHFHCGFEKMARENGYRKGLFKGEERRD